MNSLGLSPSNINKHMEDIFPIEWFRKLRDSRQAHHGMLKEE